MPAEHSAGAIVIRYENSCPLVLLIKAKPLETEYWDFPKGMIEKGEAPEKTAEREAREETGISDLKLLPGFVEKESWFYKREGKTIFKTVTYFLFETREARVTPQEKEILEVAWVPINEAIGKVTFKRSKALLEKAKEFLEKKKKEGLERFMG